MALYPNKDFSCTSSACKPLTEAAKALYRRLQIEINKFASLKGFSSLTPDGVVGEKTAQAVLKIMPEAFTLLAPSGLPFMSGALDAVRLKQAMAEIAVDPDKFYVKALQKAAGLPVSPAPVQVPGVVAPPTIPMEEVVPSGGTPIWMFVVGGLALATMGVGTYMLMKE
jgi:hypothetical protein